MVELTQPWERINSSSNFGLLLRSICAAKECSHIIQWESSPLGFTVQHTSFFKETKNCPNSLAPNLHLWLFLYDLCTYLLITSYLQKLPSHPLTSLARGTFNKIKTSPPTLLSDIQYSLLTEPETSDYLNHFHFCLMCFTVLQFTTILFSPKHARDILFS